MKSLYLWIWNFLRVGGTKWKNHGNSRGGGSNVKPSWKIRGVRSQTGVNPLWGGMDIFWNHTISVQIFCHHFT